MFMSLSAAAFLFLAYCFISIESTKISHPTKLQRAYHRTPVGAAIAFPADLPSSRCANLQRSLEARGATFDGITIKRYSANERTIVATKDVPAGRVMIRMPVRCCVTPSSAIKEYGAAADAGKERDKIGTDDKDVLAIWLLSKRAESKVDLENGSGSGSDPFIESLPTLKELEHLPVNWSKDDVSWLSSSMDDSLSERKQGELHTFAMLTKAIENFDGIAPTFSHWTWAKCITRSRAFSISNPLLDDPFPGTCIGEDEDENEDTSDGVDLRVPALVPLADMINHVKEIDGCTCEWGSERSTGDFLVRTLKDVSAGDEITISYGSSSATARLLNYGFVYESKSYDDDADEANDLASVMLSLDLIMENCEQEDIVGILSNEDLLGLKRQVWARDEGRYPDWGWGPLERVVANQIGNVEAAKSTLSLIRFGVATSEELHVIIEANNEADEEMAIAAMMAREPICWRNERAALRCFESIVNSQLKSYPEKSIGLNQNQINALKVSKAEKEVLQHFSALARMAGDTLDKRSNNFDFGMRYAQLFEGLLGTRERIGSK